MKGGETMKALIIKGLTLPEMQMDLRIYSDGKVQIVGCMGYSGPGGTAEEIEIPDEE